MRFSFPSAWFFPMSASFFAAPDAALDYIPNDAPSIHDFCNCLSNREELVCEKMGLPCNEPILCHGNGSDTSVPPRDATTSPQKKICHLAHRAQHKHWSPV